MNNILKWLNLLDNDKLSLTNLALVIILVKISISSFDYAGAAILLPILGSYIHKRHIKSNKDKEEGNTIQSLKDKIESLVVNHEEIDKTLQDAKKVISEHKIAQSFAPKRNY